MKIYIRPKPGRRITLGYRELAKKMWFKEKNGKELEISHVGNDEIFKEECILSLSINKWINDKRWEEDNSEFLVEYLELEKKDQLLLIETTHIDILTVDKRALYIMAIEIAQNIDGAISEDDQESWLTVQEFQQKHQDILSLSYDEANERSFIEAKTMVAVDEPWDWDE